MDRKVVLICFVCITTFTRILSFELGHLQQVVADEFNKTEEIILDNPVLEVDSSTLVSTPTVSDQPDLDLVGLKTEASINHLTGDDLESHSYDESASTVGRSKRQGLQYASQYGYVLYDPEYDQTRCPPFEDTCPLHQIANDLCNYQIVMKVLILGPPRVDDKERICGRLGKLSALRDISETRTILTFSAKDSCGCPLKDNTHYIIISKVQALSKQGALYAQISLSDNTALLPFDAYIEKDIMERLRLCPSSTYKPLDSSYTRNTYSFQVTSKPVHVKPITYSTPVPISYSTPPQPYIWPQPSSTYAPIPVPTTPQSYILRPNPYAPLPVICFPHQINNPLPSPSKNVPFTQKYIYPPSANYPLPPPPAIDATYPSPVYVTPSSPTNGPPPSPLNYELSPTLKYASQPQPKYVLPSSPNNIRPLPPNYGHPQPSNYDPQPPPNYDPQPPPNYANIPSTNSPPLLPNAPAPQLYVRPPPYVPPSSIQYPLPPPTNSPTPTSKHAHVASKPATPSSAIPEAFKSPTPPDYVPHQQQHANPSKSILYVQSNPPRTLYETPNYQNPPSQQQYNTPPPYTPQKAEPFFLPVEETYSSSYPPAYDSSQQQYVSPAEPKYDPIPFEEYPQPPRSSYEATLGQQYASTQEPVSVSPQQWNPAPAPPYVPPPPSNYGLQTAQVYASKYEQSMGLPSQPSYPPIQYPNINPKILQISPTKSSYPLPTSEKTTSKKPSLPYY